MTTQDYPGLSNLSGMVVAVANATDDMRGRKVKDKDGKDFGRLHDVFIDEREHKPRFLLVDHDGFLGIGEKKSFIPVNAIWATTSDDVFLKDTHDHIAGAPGYEPDLINDHSYQSRIYAYYGYAAYWSAGYDLPRI